MDAARVWIIGAYPDTRRLIGLNLRKWELGTLEVPTRDRLALCDAKEVESLAEWERYPVKVFVIPQFGEWFARMTPLVGSGRREFYNIET